MIVLASTDARIKCKISYSRISHIVEHTQYRVGYGNIRCDCVAIAKNGIEYADASTPTIQGYKAIFEAYLQDGYVFDGWYSDEECTVLVSRDNPASITTPSTGELDTCTTLTLYAKATKASTTGTGIYLKTNGAHQEAQAVYKKIDGAWVTDVDSCKALLSQLDRVGTIVKRL